MIIVLAKVSPKPDKKAELLELVKGRDGGNKQRGRLY